MKNFSDFVDLVVFGYGLVTEMGGIGHEGLPGWFGRNYTSLLAGACSKRIGKTVNE
jgi:hypothetical protein